MALFERDRKQQSRIRYRDEIKELDKNSCSVLRLTASCPLHWGKQSFGHCPFQVTRPWLQKASIQEASETTRAVNRQHPWQPNQARSSLRNGLCPQERKWPTDNVKGKQRDNIMADITQVKCCLHGLDVAFATFKCSGSFVPKGSCIKEAVGLLSLGPCL